jgi:hypothetical protein
MLEATPVPVPYMLPEERFLSSSATRRRVARRDSIDLISYGLIQVEEEKREKS